ncbi:hypothetical protein [Saccharothrix lopnurensis]|uniref:LPXTG-motif cell wall-anchored protein n=1 Tax=Saccharothrix lopnurensis TaxID=1670621 RepID=A0ABW1PCK7_9PSEU
MRTTTRALLTAAAVLSAALVTTALLSAPLLSAATAGPALARAGDSRATAVVGDVRPDSPGDACDVVGLPGDELVPPADTHTRNGPYLDVVAFPPGRELTGVVVAGGGAYHVYPAATLHDLPWEGLRAPLDQDDLLPAVEHWFACAIAVATTSPTTDSTAATSLDAPVTSPNGAAPVATSPRPTTTRTTATAATATPAATTRSTTTTAPAAPAADARPAGLATTGAAPAGAVVLGLALLVTGLALLAATRSRRPRHRPAHRL